MRWNVQSPPRSRFHWVLSARPYVPGGSTPVRDASGTSTSIAELTRSRSSTGRYDPPYGPGSASSSKATAAVPDHDFELALTEFHLSRLLDFASSEDVWRQVSIVLFETIPNLVEAKAIRRAYAGLSHRLRDLYGGAGESDSAPATGDQWWRKPVVMSFVFPDETADGEGAFPTPVDGPTPTPEEVLGAATSENHDDSTATVEYATLDGVGINCTKPFKLRQLVRRWNTWLQAQSTADAERHRPWLWLYPDGGLQYDVHTRTWSTIPSKHSSNGVDSNDPASTWARGVVAVADSARASGVWPGVVLGGCCKAGTGHIRALAEASDERK